MANIKLARQKLDQPADLEMAMVTVDPIRDLDTLATYVTGFIPDGHALGTDDDAALSRAASAFGVSYDVSTDAGGDSEVAHTTLLYAVDADGHVVLAWPFGVSIDDLAADIEFLLDQQ
jgi:cytochrome oxidase Cu insertion factor (SCO1/SenC/PrrC family)